MATESARAGLLSVVGTPIGNLEDASPRCLATLAAADAILCEDTRVTAKLLARYEIRMPLERCDENVIASRAAGVVERLHAGARLAFASDAGMPCISDPGQRLVDAVLDAGLAVEVVPGPSAVSCAIAASGLSCENFFFEGFLPRKAGERTRRLERLASVPGALVVYESPHRVARTLADIAAVMPGRRVALCRELTKLHEEVVRGMAGELAELVAARDEVRGECVVVVEAPGEDELAGREAAAAGEPSLEEAVAAGVAAGEPKSALAKRLARAYGVSRSEAYDLVLRAAEAAGE